MNKSRFLVSFFSKKVLLWLTSDLNMIYYVMIYFRNCVIQLSGVDVSNTILFRRVGTKNGIGIFAVFTKFFINIKWFTITIHFLDNISINNKIACSVWNVFFSGLFEVKRFDNFTIYWTDVSYISKTCPAKLSKTNYLRHDQFSFRAFGNLSHFQE